MDYKPGTVARVVHEFAALERRVAALERAAAQPRDQLVEDAFTPLPKDATTWTIFTNAGPVHGVGGHGVGPVTTATNATAGIYVSASPGAANFVRPPQGVREHPAYAKAGELVKVTWEDEISGVKVTSPPCANLYDARRAVRRLFEAANGEHLATFKPSLWFTVEHFRKLRATVAASPEECIRALHATADYEHALAYLLGRNAKLK